ncbi:hypothetical protein PEBR_28553 [Penicillium brasilianum]|uniref:Uncharacterized protein n=1 Tax=Penicillium brasilianum TaxID=104259 RepID=A0A1S9RH53_PENBI|nr:hypothetical protein PEBR_28553 [Penicillium brasilianum]
MEVNKTFPGTVLLASLAGLHFTAANAPVALYETIPSTLYTPTTRVNTFPIPSIPAMLDITSRDTPHLPDIRLKYSLAGTNPTESSFSEHPGPCRLCRLDHNHNRLSPITLELPSHSSPLGKVHPASQDVRSCILHQPLLYD